MKDTLTSVAIEVLRGKHWKNSQLIVTKDRLIDPSQTKSQLMIVSAEVKDDTVQAHLMGVNP